MRLSVAEMRRFYTRVDFDRYDWCIRRKHFRIETLNGKWVKLNQHRPVHVQRMRKALQKYVPRHAYMSITDYLFPERVGRKYKAKYAVPMGGEFVVDVDSRLRSRSHGHFIDPRLEVCAGCLEISKHLALEICDHIAANYRNVQIVFSGRRGFHLHVLDFEYRDWAKPNAKYPLKTMSNARYKYAVKVLPHDWDRHHFIVSVDPLRLITIPNTLNYETGLICLHLDRPTDLASLEIPSLLERADPTKYVWQTLFQPCSYPEPLTWEAMSAQLAKNRGRDHG
jgi:hypothetical protein